MVYLLLDLLLALLGSESPANAATMERRFPVLSPSSIQRDVERGNLLRKEFQKFCLYVVRLLFNQPMSTTGNNAAPYCLREALKLFERADTHRNYTTALRKAISYNERGHGSSYASRVTYIIRVHRSPSNAEEAVRPGLWQFQATLWQLPTISRPHRRTHQSTENYSVVSGEFMNIANGYRRRFGWSNRIVRRGKGRRHDELLEAGR